MWKSLDFDPVHTVLTIVGKSTTSNVVFLAQNEANYRDMLFNKMVQQTIG